MKVLQPATAEYMIFIHHLNLSVLLQLEELLERKTELEMLVMAIEQNLRSHGYDFRKNDYVTPTLQPGIRIKGELSFRGKKKSRELFGRLDENNSDKLYFEDFRG